MKKLFQYIFSALLFLVAGCSPDSISHPSEGGIPLAADINAEILVDQTTNEVTFKINNRACNPVWIFEDGKVSTVNGLTKTFVVAGTYQVEVKISNRNGISDGSVFKEFVIENTIMDFTPYLKRLSGDGTKNWVWASDMKGHIGCGESGSDGLGWYSAEPGDKAAWGMYDDLFSFTNAYEYTYNPGEGGTVFVNTGCSVFSQYNTGDGQDFMAPVDPMTVGWEFVVEGNDVYLQFPEKTLLGYVPNDEIYNAPKFRVVTIKENLLELVADNGAIAWHYILQPAVAEKTKAELLAGSVSKNWVWDRNTQGHLGCGESGTDGLGWFSAAPNDKADWGLYDDVFTFGADGKYLYNPGEGGTVYVNAGCTLFAEHNTNDGKDFMVPTEPQTASWQLVEEGADLYLVFPAKTLVGYIPNDDAYNVPRFKILEISETTLDMLIDNGSIAWHYRFVAEGNEGTAPDTFEEGEELMPSEYAKALIGSWTWEPSVGGHFGCGENAGNPTGWWSAPANDKEGKGLYDDILTFKADGGYVFNPGAGGTLYVNTGCGLFPEANTNDGEDFQVAVAEQTASYTLETADGNYFLQFPPNTYVSYLSADALFTNPRFQIVRMCDNILEMVSIQSGIAWKYRFKKID
ncbi:MAG: PKD domain-containing protein [Bacteroidales bacterium]